MQKGRLKILMENRYDILSEYISDLHGVGVAFSGGVDSTLLLKVCLDLLGKRNVMALTAVSPLVPGDELHISRRLATELGVERHLMVDVPDIESGHIRRNEPDRCYHCKKTIFTEFTGMLKDGYVLVDGTNKDDMYQDRPGTRAIEELGVISPLAECGIGKDDIRKMAKELGLDNWDRPSQSCLATRIPHGERVLASKLKRIDRGESYLKQHGFYVCRLRCQGDVAILEVPSKSMRTLLDKRSELIEGLKDLGFKKVAVDLQGIRKGIECIEEP